MNELMIFSSPDFGTIRTLEENGAVMFCGTDVAKALGYTNPSKALSDHCKGDLTNRYPVVDALGRTQDTIFIPESDLYRLVFRSKLPNAEKFTDWVVEEVLPSIRKNGGYIAGQETMSDVELMARALAAANRILAEREARLAQVTVQNAIMQPKADYFDELVERSTLTNFRETAKQLGVPPKKFVEFLLSKRYIYRDKRGKLLPYEDKNNGLFEVKETFNEKTQWSGIQTLVTPKGRETFRLLCAGAA